MKKQIGKNLMQKWKNKIRVRLSALDKKKLVLTNIPYILTAFYTNRASFLYRNSLGEDIGNKLLYAMEHADRILTGLQPSFNWRDMLTGIVAAVILKLLVWQKQSDAKKLRKGIEYGSARWGNAEDIKPYMSEDAHLSSRSVSAGASVTKGDEIGLVGNTGNSTGSHLHIELLKNGERLNPIFYLETGEGAGFGGNEWNF